MTSPAFQITIEQQQLATQWAAARNRWFAANPDREFQLTPLADAELRAIALAGFVVAAFDTAPIEPGSAIMAKVVGDQLAIVRRRGDWQTGFDVLLAPSPPSRFLPPPAIEEEFARGIWSLAQFASNDGKSMRALAEATPEIRNHKLPTLH